MPLSGFLGRATEELAVHTGPTIGGLLNATLGNLAELIIAILALRAGLIDLVKASITGSILGNLLLVLGAAQLVGGLEAQGAAVQRRARGAERLAAGRRGDRAGDPGGLSTPPTPTRTRSSRRCRVDRRRGLLIVGYVLSLVYSMWTHRSVFGEARDVAQLGTRRPTQPGR